MDGWTEGVMQWDGQNRRETERESWHAIKGFSWGGDIEGREGRDQKMGNMGIKDKNDEKG